MTPPTISPEARKAEEAIHTIQCKDGMVFRSEVQEQIQLAINTSIEALEIRHAAVMLHTQGVVDENTKLTKENAELRKENKAMRSWGYFICLHHTDKQRQQAGCAICATRERDQLQARVKEFEEASSRWSHAAGKHAGEVYLLEQERYTLIARLATMEKALRTIGFINADGTEDNSEPCGCWQTDTARKALTPPTPAKEL